MYLTNALRQRFMSNMSTKLSVMHSEREVIEEDITNKSFIESAYYWRIVYKKYYVRNSTLQAHVKRGLIDHRTLQKMEKVVTLWINSQQRGVQYAYEDYLDNRYNPFYRNRSKQAKQKLAKLVELQQAIRKQKRITRS